MFASEDERRTARLIAGASAPLNVVPPSLSAAARRRRTRPKALRALQRAAMHRGRLTFEGTILTRERARAETVGRTTRQPPRFLVRVDEYPHWLVDDDPRSFGTDAFERFHAIMAEAEVPYLLAAVARPSERPADPRHVGDRPLTDTELNTLARVQGEGVEIGIHGLDHRTRDPHPRRQSELLGRPPEELRERLALADEALRPVCDSARVFVPPWNRFEARQWPALAGRYDIVCGGPESVMQVGFHGAPTWWGDAVYLPSYAPFYEHAGIVEPAARQARDRSGGGWIPIVLHWGWEAEDGWTQLRRLVRTLSGHAAQWSELHAEIATIRGQDEAPRAEPDRGVS